MAFSLKIPEFAIKPISKQKANSEPRVKKSRLLTGITVVEEGKYRIKVDLKDEVYGNNPIFDFDVDSLDNKGKEYLYCLVDGTLVINMRTQEYANLFPGDDRWSPVVENVLCTGWLVKNKTSNKLEFKIKTTHGYGKENNYKQIDKNLPLYNE